MKYVFVSLMKIFDWLIITGFLCNPVMENENWFQLLQTLNITCSNSNLKEKLWGEEWHPSYKAESRSCIGYINTPSFINCSAVAPAGEKRICECDEICKLSLVQFNKIEKENWEKIILFFSINKLF